MSWLQYATIGVCAGVLEILHPNFGLILILLAGLDAYMQVNKRKSK